MKQIAALLAAHAPQLLARHGVGAVTAAQLLVTAGANPHRLRGNAAPAALCGASPVQASSGTTAKRTATGNSREIMRMLQRYAARELYPLIISALQPAAAGHRAGPERLR